MPSVWDDPKLVEQLEALYVERYPCSQIARQLGRGISRNAVIGRLNRMGLRSYGAGPVKRAPSVPKPKAIPPSFPEPVQLLPPLLIDGQKVTLMTLTSGMCKWPIGDPASRDFCFCGNEPKTHSPYCLGHAAIAFQPLNPTRRVSDENKAIVASMEIMSGIKRAFGG